MVPISTPEFLAELPARFREADGMVFLPEQLGGVREGACAHSADRSRQSCSSSDERSAIDWLTNFSQEAAIDSGDPSGVHPQIGSAKKKARSFPNWQLLEDNFFRYDGSAKSRARSIATSPPTTRTCAAWTRTTRALVAKAKDRWYVPDPNKAQDLEKKREKALLKEFETYRAFTGRKIKESRLEVLRAGFKKAGPTRTTRPSSTSPISCLRRRCRKTRSCCSGTTRR